MIEQDDMTRADPADVAEQVLSTTRAIRHYSDDPVDLPRLRKVLMAATYGPSGGNRQPFRFVVLRDGPRARAVRDVLGPAYRAEWKQQSAHAKEADDHPRRTRSAQAMQRFVDDFERVPVLVLACIESYRNSNPWVDPASIFPACQNLLIMARAVGLGGVLTLWHIAVENQVREIVGIPTNVSIACVIPIGVPRGGHGPLRRRPVDEIAFEESWGQRAAWLADQ